MRLTRTGIAALVVVCGLGTVATLAAQQTTNFSERVAIGSRSLWLNCTGAGKPTVLLEAGHGETSETWAPVVSHIAAFTRVCTYDRAGVGRSDPPAPGPRTALSVTTDLHALLKAARETGPFVLVGHSLGGAFVRLYATENPIDVAAVVLVDAVHERDFTAVDELLTSEQRTAGSGMRPPSPERLDIEAILGELGRARSVSTIPFIVLARGRPLGSDEMPPSWSADQRKRREELRRSLQADLATLSTTGALITALRSGHFIHHDEPALVTGAIRQLVEGWRRRR
ncbi:MAG: alpha/beta hydrolase [Vicinamibacterales bacterium]